MSEKLAVVILLVAYLASSAQGLQCYTCGHVAPPPEAIPPPLDQLLDPSCKAGNIPLDKFVIDCDPSITDPVCSRVNAKLVLPDPINTEIEFTIRGCMDNWNGQPGGCQNVTVAEMLLMPDLGPEFKDFLEQLKPTDSAQICTCSQDKCRADDENSCGGGGGDNCNCSCNCNCNCNRYNQMPHISNLYSLFTKQKTLS